MDLLQSGMGLCRPEAQLSIRATRPVVELGAVADVVHGVLNAVHHANRHDTKGNRIAVALPGLHVHRGRSSPGHEVVLFGSEAALRGLIELDGMRKLVRRAMIARLEIDEAWLEPGGVGTAFVRDRATARRTPGALRRARERALRRGISMPEHTPSAPPDPTILALNYGTAVVHVRALEGVVTEAPLPIGTYGFAPSSRPAFLPVRLDRAALQADDAA